MVDRESAQQDRIREAEPYEGYWQDSYDYVFRKLREYFSREDFKRAIEFGAGQGSFFRDYADFFKDVIAVEEDWKSRDRAMENAYWSDQKHIEFRKSEEDGEELEKCSFDLVFVGQSFRHMSVDQSEDMVDKAAELLRRGGILVVFVPHQKKGQESFLKTYLDEENGYTTEPITKEEFESIEKEDESQLRIRRYDPDYFNNKEDFKLDRTIYFHDLILPSFLDRYVSRDALINQFPFRGRFGSEVALVLKKT